MQVSDQSPLLRADHPAEAKIIKPRTFFFALTVPYAIQWILIAIYPMNSPSPYVFIGLQSLIIASYALFFASMRVLCWLRPQHMQHYREYYDSACMSDVSCMLLLLFGALAMIFKPDIEWPVYAMQIINEAMIFVGMYLTVLTPTLLNRFFQRYFVVDQIDAPQEIGHIVALVLCIVWAIIHGFYESETVLWLNVLCLLLWVSPLLMFAISTLFDGYHWRTAGMSCRHAPAFWFLWSVYMMILGVILLARWSGAGWTSAPDGIPWAMLFGFGIPSMLFLALFCVMFVLGVLVGIARVCLAVKQCTTEVCCPV